MVVEQEHPDRAVRLSHGGHGATSPLAHASDARPQVTGCPGSEVRRHGDLGPYPAPRSPRCCWAAVGLGSGDAGSPPGTVRLVGGRRRCGDPQRGGVFVFAVTGRTSQEAGRPRLPGLPHPAARRAACQREVELNRRLAPDVYLGVADVSGVDGAVCDHLVVMRRMPDGSAACPPWSRAGADVDGRAAPPWPGCSPPSTPPPAGHREIAAQGTRDAMRGRWEASFEQVRPFVGTVLDAGRVDEIERLAPRYLAGRGPLFDARIARGPIVDGHGDLLADDVFCLDDGPRVLDCLEFDDRLRYARRAGRRRLPGHGPGAARRRPSWPSGFLDWYAEFAGDPAPPSLRAPLHRLPRVRPGEGLRPRALGDIEQDVTDVKIERLVRPGPPRGCCSRRRPTRPRSSWARADSVASPGWCSARSASRCCGTRPAPS